MSECLEIDQIEVYWSIDIDITKLACGVSCSYIYASLLVVRAMLFQDITWKSDQLIVYASRLLNKVKQNYSTIKIKALTMVFALHKFKHYLLGNKFVFCVGHMALVYLVNIPHV
jgi:hypothetical protein